MPGLPKPLFDSGFAVLESRLRTAQTSDEAAAHCRQFFFDLQARAAWLHADSLAYLMVATHEAAIRQDATAVQLAARLGWNDLEDLAQWALAYGAYAGSTAAGKSLDAAFRRLAADTAPLPEAVQWWLAMGEKARGYGYDPAPVIGLAPRPRPAQRPPAPRPAVFFAACRALRLIQHEATKTAAAFMQASLEFPDGHASESAVRNYYYRHGRVLSFVEQVRAELRQMNALLSSHSAA
jgi:hypothetical protein